MSGDVLQKLKEFGRRIHLQPDDVFYIQLLMEKVEAADRERCAGLVKKSLMFNDQRAYSWHEAHDVMMSILNGTQPQ